MLPCSRSAGGKVRDYDLQRFVLEFDPALPSISTSDEHVFRILGNLVDNAIKYSPPASPITVSARCHDGGMLVSVTDGGGGVPAEERDRIFDRFYQVDHSSTRRVGGAGMGLYIWRQAAELLGGRLWVEASGSAGSMFCLWLPMTTPQMAPAVDRRPTAQARDPAP